MSMYRDEDVIALVVEVRRLRSRVAFHEGINLIKNAEAMGLSKDLMTAYAKNECGTVVADADRPLFRCKRAYNHDGPCSPRRKCLPGIGTQCLDKVDCKAASSSASALRAELAAANARADKAEAQLGIAVQALSERKYLRSAELRVNNNSPFGVVTRAVREKEKMARDRDLPPQVVSIRRTLEQIRHCVEEAESICFHGEPKEQALQDLDQAATLLGYVQKYIANGGF